MTNNGSEIALAKFQATTEAELRHIGCQIKLLWEHNRKRREEIGSVERKLTAEVESIKAIMNRGVLWLALAAGGLLFSIVRAKLGL